MKRVPSNHGIDDVCAELAQMFDAGDKDAFLETVRHLLGSALSQANTLAARVAQLQRQLYGRKSERINPDQLTLAFTEQQGKSAENEDDDSDGTGDPEPTFKRDPRWRAGTRKAKKRGRKPLPADLEREEIRLVPTQEQLAATSGSMSKVDEKRSEVLEYEPARFKVLVYVREVWSNSVGEIVTAPAPNKVIDKGIPGPGLLTHVVISKYDDHCPLNRQVKIYQRLGVQMSRNTLVDWVAAVADLLQPLARMIFNRVMVSQVLQVDDTRLPVLDRRKGKNIKKGRLWALVGDHFYVAYRYTEDWRGESVARFLSSRVGWMQVDGYKGYEAIFSLGLATEVGCWMHCRRYFVKAFEGGDLRAARPLELIGKMYKVEDASKRAVESNEQRFERRVRETRPLLDELKTWHQTHAGHEPPSTPLGQALTYTANQWTALLRPLEDGALELDNGDVERAMRGPAMGRRNWLFAGSDEGAERTAIIKTVLESATRHGLDLREYVHDVLVKISSGWPNRRLDELLPHRWRELRGARGQPEGQPAQTSAA